MAERPGPAKKDWISGQLIDLLRKLFQWIKPADVAMRRLVARTAPEPQREEKRERPDDHAERPAMLARADRHHAQADNKEAHAAHPCGRDAEE